MLEQEKIENPLEVKQENTLEQETAPVPELSPAEKEQALNSELEQNQQEIAGLEQSKIDTQKSLAEIRGELGIPPSDEIPPSIAASESRIGSLKTTQENILEEKNKLGTDTPEENKQDSPELVEDKPTMENREGEEKKTGTPDVLEVYKKPDASLDYWQVTKDLSDKNFSGGLQERLKIADEALARLQTEANALRGQIDAEKNRVDDLRKNGKWDGSQKSELGALNKKDDTLYGHEQNIKRLKKDLEKSISTAENEQPVSDKSVPEGVKEENGRENFIEVKDRELREEIGNSLSQIVQDIDGLEGSLRVGGKFIAPRFEGDALRTAVNESGIDFKKASGVFEDITRKLKRDFTTESGSKRPMIESSHYRRAIGALENLENGLSKFRSKIDQRKTATNDENFKNLTDEISATINAARTNREFLNSLRSISQRFEDRRY